MSARARYFLPGGSRNGRVIDMADPFRPDFETDDPAVFMAEAKRRKLRPRYRTVEGKPARALTAFPKPRRVSFTRKPFDPALGEVGSWVRGTDMSSGQRIEGQVWSLVNNWNGCVWVVSDDQKAHMCRVALLEPLHLPVEQPDLLAAAVESGHLEIVRVSA